MPADTVIKHNHKAIKSRRPVTDWHRPFFGRYLAAATSPVAVAVPAVRVVSILLFPDYSILLNRIAHMTLIIIEHMSILI